MFDCVFHSSLKAHPKPLLVELALNRVESQNANLLLSREVGMPNIRHKGELQPIPNTAAATPTTSIPPKRSKPLIEVIESKPASLRQPAWTIDYDDDKILISIKLPGLV